MSRRRAHESRFSTADGLIDPSRLILNGNTSQEDPLYTNRADTHKPGDFTIQAQPTSLQGSNEDAMKMGHGGDDHSDLSIPDCSGFPADTGRSGGSSEFIDDNLEFVVPGRQRTDPYAVPAEHPPHVIDHTDPAQSHHFNAFSASGVTPICSETENISGNSCCDALGSRQITGSARAACQSCLDSRRQITAYKRERKGHSPSNVPHHQNDTPFTDDMGGKHPLDRSMISGALDPSKRNVLSQRQLGSCRERSLQALRAYDPSQITVVPETSSVFIPLQHLQLDLSLCHNVIVTTTEQDQISGQEFTIIEGSKCSGLDDSACGGDVTRLLHRWKIDKKHGLLITAVQGACAECASQHVYPIPTCGYTDQRTFRRCRKWASRYRQRRKIRTGYCPGHMDHFKDQNRSSGQKRRLKRLQDQSSHNIASVPQTRPRHTGLRQILPNPATLPPDRTLNISSLSPSTLDAPHPFYNES